MERRPADRRRDGGAARGAAARPEARRRLRCRCRPSPACPCDPIPGGLCQPCRRPHHGGTCTAHVFADLASPATPPCCPCTRPSTRPTQSAAACPPELLCTSHGGGPAPRRPRRAAAPSTADWLRPRRRRSGRPATSSRHVGKRKTPSDPPLELVSVFASPRPGPHRGRQVHPAVGRHPLSRTGRSSSAISWAWYPYSYRSVERTPTTPWPCSPS